MTNLLGQMIFSSSRQYDEYCDAPPSTSTDDDTPSVEKMQADGMCLAMSSSTGDDVVIQIDQPTDKAAPTSSSSFSSSSALLNRKARGAPLMMNEAACGDMGGADDFPLDDESTPNSTSDAHEITRSSSEPIDTSVKPFATERKENGDGDGDDSGKKGEGSLSAPSTPSKPMHGDAKYQESVEAVSTEGESDTASTKSDGTGKDHGFADGQGDGDGPVGEYESIWKYGKGMDDKGWDDHERGKVSSSFANHAKRNEKGIDVPLPTDRVKGMGGDFNGSLPTDRAKDTEGDLNVSLPVNVPSGDEAAVIGKALHESLHSESDFAKRCMADLAAPMDIEKLCTYLGEVIKLQGGVMRDAVKDIMDHADKTENITKLDMLLYQHRLTGSTFYKTDKGVVKQVTL